MIPNRIDPRPIDRDTVRNNIKLLFVIGIILGVAGAAAMGAVFNDTVPVSGTVPLETNSGAVVHVTGASNLTGTEYLDDNRVKIVSDQGNVTIGSSGSANATVAAGNISGTWTNVTNLDVASNELYINPEDKSAANVSGDTDAFAFRNNIAVTDDTPDFVYSGGSGTTTVTVRGVAPGVRVVASDESGTTLGSGTSNANGVVTLSGLPNSEHVVTLSAESGPYVKSADPNNEYINQRNVDLNATVVDPKGDDFDSVWLQHYDNGAWTNVTVETNLPSGNEINGSVTANPGENQYRVVMNATGNRDVVSDNITFQTPGYIIIYNGTTEVVLDQTTVTGGLASTAGNYQDSVTTTTGEADLNDTNPPNEILRSEWSASGVENQSLMIHDPSRNYTVALYDSGNSATYTQCFSVSDPTGTFTETNSWVILEQHIDGEWKTVASERFGVENEADIVLEDGEDYRVRLRNEDGDVRVLDGYTADSSTTGCVVLNVESALGETDSDPDTVDWNTTCTDTTPKRVKFEYNDTLQKTSTIYYSVYEYRNESNVLVPNTTFSGTFGTFSYTANVPQEQNTTDWTVDAIAVRDDADNIQIQRVVCGSEDVLPTMAPWLVSFLFVGFVWITAGLFSQLNGDIGGIVVAGLGAMFWFAGFAPPMLGGGVVALSLLTAGIMFIRERGGGL